MKLKDIMNLRGIFAARAQEVLSVPLALKILKFKRATAAEAEFYTERQRHIITTCGETDEDGNLIREEGGIPIRPERVAEYRKQTAELDETESDAALTLCRAELAELGLTLAELELAAEFITEEEEG